MTEILINGFVAAGASAAASPETFDKEVGRRIARSDARDHLSAE